MPAPTRSSILFLYLILPCCAFSQEEGTRDDELSFRAELVQRIHQIAREELSADDSVSLCLAASEAFSGAKLEELAGHFFQQAIHVANASDARKHQYRLFDHAVKIHDLKTAAKISEDSDRPGRFLDRLAVERYRRGDDEALEGFPDETLDFYIALDLADAYAQRREYEKLEAFVRGIDSLPSNEPTDVGAIIWARIADDFRERGEMARAKEFIDKAMEIGGNNYYTGYGIRVAHLSIHGGLKEQAERFAKQAVAYRGHHASELLSGLIGELVAAGHYDVAKDTLRYYPTDEERLSAEKYLALALAQQKQFDEAIDIAKAIKDEAESAQARTFVAGQLLEAGKLQPAKALAHEAADLLAKQSDSSAGYHTLKLIRLLAQMNERERVMQIIEAAGSSLDRGRRTAAAIEGISLRISTPTDEE